MDKKRKEEEVLELTADEIDELVFEEQLASGEYDEEVPEYYFPTRMPRSSLAPMMPPSVSLLSMKRATSSSRICLPFGCPM